MNVAVSEARATQLVNQTPNQAHSGFFPNTSPHKIPRLHIPVIGSRGQQQPTVKAWWPTSPAMAYFNRGARATGFSPPRVGIG